MLSQSIELSLYIGKIIFILCEQPTYVTPWDGSPGAGSVPGSDGPSVDVDRCNIRLTAPHCERTKTLTRLGTDQ